MFRRGARLLGACLVVLVTASTAPAAEPHVLATLPVRHGLAPRGTAVRITFDQALLPASVTGSSFRVFGMQTGRAAGSVALSNGDKTLTLTPTSPFAAGETVRVNLSHDVKASDGTPLRRAGWAFEFLVAAAPARRTFTQIDEMSNRIAGVQTRIYGALAADLDGDRAIDLATVNEVSGDLQMPDLAAVTGPVTVQLHRSGGGPCFGATFSAPFLARDAGQLKDRAD